MIRLYKANRVTCALLMYFLAGSVVQRGWSVEQKPPEKVPGFQELSFKGDESFLTCNGDGSRLGVVSGLAPGNSGFSRKSLQVWTLGSALTPDAILYQSSLQGTFSSTITWAGNYLLFSTLQAETKTSTTTEPLSPADSYAKRIQGFAVSAVKGDLISFGPAAADYLVPHPVPNQVLVVNPLEEQLKGLRPGMNRSNAREALLPAQIYDMPLNQGLRELSLPLTASGNREPKEFVPLFISADGQHLITSVVSEYPWKNKQVSSNRLNYLISISLADGTVKQLTSGDEPDALYLRNNMPFAPGLPCAVENGKQVACAMNAHERNLNYRFQYYSPEGELVNEIKVNDRDLQRANLPSGGEVITWTPEGNVILQVGADIWLFDVENWKASLLTKGLSVEEVHGFAAEKGVLVRVRKAKGTTSSDITIRGNPAKIDLPMFSEETYWGFLLLPNKT